MGGDAVTERELDIEIRAHDLVSQARTVPRLLWDQHDPIPEAPHRVPGSVPYHVELTGCLSPFFSNGQPAFVRVMGSGDMHVALFSSKATFDSFNAVMKLGHDKLVQVMDESEFLSSIPSGVLVILDPRFEEDKVRYKQVLR